MEIILGFIGGILIGSSMTWAFVSESRIRTEVRVMEKLLKELNIKLKR